MNNEESEHEDVVQAEESGAPQLKACTFNVGDRSFSIALEYIREITEISEIFPLPLTPEYVDGIVHFRGVAMPVINIAKILKIEEEQQKVKRLIVLNKDNDNFGIAVNDMPDLISDFPGEVIDVQEFYEKYRVAL